MYLAFKQRHVNFLFRQNMSQLHYQRVIQQECLPVGSVNRAVLSGAAGESVHSRVRGRFLYSEVCSVGVGAYLVRTVLSGVGGCTVVLSWLGLGGGYLYSKVCQIDILD